jgi:oligosaccharide repeat unit polymerase
MKESLAKQYILLKWFTLFIVIETVILLKIVNSELIVFKVLLNYLFVLALVPIIIIMINREKFDPFSPYFVFSASYLLLFGICGLDLLFFKYDLLIIDKRFYTFALAYSILGLHFFQLGYISKIGLLITKKKRYIKKKWSFSKVKILIIVYSLVSFLSLLTIFILSGGVSYYYHNIKNATLSLLTGSSVFFMFIVLIKIPLLIWFYICLEKRKMPKSFFLLFLFAMFLLVSLGERGPFILLIISMMVCFHYVRKPLRILPITIFTFLLFLFLVLYGQYREITGQDFKTKKYSQINSTFVINHSYRSLMNHFDQFERVKDIIQHVPENLEFQLGKTFFNLALKPIPSRIWEGKPQGAGMVVTKKLYPKHFASGSSFAPSIIGELYLNFQIIGIITGMFLFGVGIRALTCLLETNVNNRNFIVFYSLILPEIFNQIRGDFAVVNSFLIFNLAFLFISLKYITFTKQNNLKYLS